MNQALSDNFLVNNVAIWITKHGYRVSTYHETFEIKGVNGKLDEIDEIYIFAPEAPDTQIGTLTLHHGQWEMTIFSESDIAEMTELASAISSTFKIDVTTNTMFEEDPIAEDDPRLVGNTDEGGSLWPTGLLILLILGVCISIIILNPNSF